jgi:hypothetical protein
LESTSEDRERELKFNKDAILFRRSEVLRLLSRGYSGADIVKEFKYKVDKSTISLDIQYIREQAKVNIQEFINEKVPEEVEKAFCSYDNIIKSAWRVADGSIADQRTKLQALMLVKDTFTAKLDLISNVDIVSRIMEIARRKRRETETTEEQEHDEGTQDEEIEEESVGEQQE